MTQINRYLEDEHMDRIDHALGRPLDPMAETYRNHYVTDANGTEAEEMRASPLWRGGNDVTGMATFHVTGDGCKALTDHLKQIRDPHRAFVVTFDGFDATVVSTSPAKARYEYWLRVSDCWPDLKFSEFLRGAKVLRAV
ncbi:hypothetical protein [Pseudochelatococcus contaminans]|uniref:Uncharacterized protein n=1 Tax=Pseudochelatococcus contaminans TaxID=1538103 RepID=A0A7W5Z2A3_9HYPH|nr:hypothetical protein [Pseudochelatococcus contaminans]MBB3808795.1 hypothetical protein [Pseudochelatococcus contaminans]